MIEGNSTVLISFTNENDMEKFIKVMELIQSHIPHCEMNMKWACEKTPYIIGETQFYCTVLYVEQNRNFSFQLAFIPMLLIPESWKLSDDERDAKIKELNMGGKWVIDNIKAVALKYHASLFFDEMYDSCAEGKYLYKVVSVDDDKDVEVVYEGRKPDYDNALCHQIMLNKVLLSHFIAEGKTDAKLQPHPWCDYLYE